MIGLAQIGEMRQWRARHDLPLGNEGGEVQIIRTIDTPLAQCKEALFSVTSSNGEDARRQWFIVTACRQGTSWKWASAEPATERWGSLQ